MGKQYICISKKIYRRGRKEGDKCVPFIQLLSQLFFTHFRNALLMIPHHIKGDAAKEMQQIAHR